MRPGVNGTVTSWPAFFAACSTAAHPPRTIRSASETRLPPDCDAVEVLLDPLERLAARSRARPVRPHSQSFCGARRTRAPFAPPRLSVPRNDAADAHAVATSRGIDRPEARIFSFSAAIVGRADQLVIDGGDGVLPQLRLRDPRAEVARDRAHVAVQELVPGLGEGVRELVGVLVEALGDRPVDRIELQREVRRQHHRRVPLGRVVRVGHRALRPRRPSASTASPRRGSRSAPSRTRRGSRGSRCPTSSARSSTRPPGRW